MKIIFLILPKLLIVKNEDQFLLLLFLLCQNRLEKLLLKYQIRTLSESFMKKQEEINKEEKREFDAMINLF